MAGAQSDCCEKSFDPGLNVGLCIGDVSKLCDVPAHTIRFWEKEFREYFSPFRTIGKQRRYGEEHLEKLLRIKKLLREDKFSIQGAKRILSGRETTSLSFDNKSITPRDTNDLARHLARFITTYMGATA